MKRAVCGLALAFFAVILAFPAAAPLAAQSSAPSAPASPVAASPSANAPPQQAYTLPPDKLAKAIAVSRIRHTLDIVSSIWSLVVLWLLLATRCSAAIENWAQRVTQIRWIQGAIFFTAFFVITELAGLPLDAIGEHYERAYAISVQSWASWFGDQAKALGVTIVIGGLVLLLFNWIVRRWPRRYWLGVWVVSVPIIVVLIFLSPLVIDPIFNQFEPLSLHHAELVGKLEQVVARTGTNVPPDRMYLMFASKKYNGLNAYVTGIGATKRIVVWDTTAGRIPDDEVQFVFGHESGHYMLNHIPKGIAIYTVALFFIYWACASVAAGLVRRFGTRWGAPDLASRTGFVVLLFTFFIFLFLLEPADNTMSRYFEHQADVYGQEAVHGIVADPQETAVAAFNALGEAWLDDPNPSPFIEFWLYSHPSTEHRAEFAMHYDPWANGGHGEFFKN
jgi:Zn-dependent protease with chaperone function